MEVYTPSFGSLSANNHYNDQHTVNPYNFKCMDYQFRKFKKSRKRKNKAFYAEALAYYMDLRFKCVRSFKMLKLTAEVEEWLVKGLDGVKTRLA